MAPFSRIPTRHHLPEATTGRGTVPIHYRSSGWLRTTQDPASRRLHGYRATANLVLEPDGSDSRGWRRVGRFPPKRGSPVASQGMPARTSGGHEPETHPAQRNPHSPRHHPLPPENNCFRDPRHQHPTTSRLPVGRCCISPGTGYGMNPNPPRRSPRQVSRTQMGPLAT